MMAVDDLDEPTWVRGMVRDAIQLALAIMSLAAVVGAWWILMK